MKLQVSASAGFADQCTSKLLEEMELPEVIKAWDLVLNGITVEVYDSHSMIDIDLWCVENCKDDWFFNITLAINNDFLTRAQELMKPVFGTPLVVGGNKSRGHRILESMMARILQNEINREVVKDITGKEVTQRSSVFSASFRDPDDAMRFKLTWGG
jgi:hypothetical protein